MKTSELIGPALDWAVAKCVGRGYPYPATTDWGVGGPIIEREGISLLRCEEEEEVDPEDVGSWVASGPGNDLHWYNDESILSFGPTPLIAAMRCYCCAKLGDEIEIPEELK